MTTEEFLSSPAHLEMVATSLTSLVYNPDPPASGLLYHYTDFVGLQGIIGSHKMWATYNKVMNDSSEQKYATDALAESIRTCMNKYGVTGVLDLGILLEEKHYLTCFCEHNDLLSMWRGYTNGGGYCLGFDYAGLDQLGDPETNVGRSGPLMVPVFYGSVPQRICDLIDECLAHPAAAQRGLDALTRYMKSFIPSTIKHEAFKEECEWRIIVRDPEESRLRFRAGATNIKPYVELTHPNRILPLRTVRIGPTARHPAAEEILRSMLKKDYPHVVVDTSGVPLQIV